MRKSTLTIWRPLTLAVAIAALAIGFSFASDSGPANFNPKPGPTNSGNNGPTDQSASNQVDIAALFTQLDLQEHDVDELQRQLTSLLGLLPLLKSYDNDQEFLSQHQLNGRSSQVFNVLQDTYNLEVRDGALGEFIADEYDVDNTAAKSGSAIGIHVQNARYAFAMIELEMDGVILEGGPIHPRYLQDAIDEMQLALARAKEAVEQTQALIDAASGTSSTPVNQAANSPTPGQDATDAASMANAVAQAGGEADSGGSD